MTDPVDRINLLEGPAFQREIAIQDADAAIADLDVDLPRRVGGPDISQVPAAYLPHRAWGRSVDVYDAAWPEPVRRAVIVAAPAVHAKKGSLDAVERALAALDVDTSISEWWEQTPRGVPYTFRVTALVRGRLYDGPHLDARMIKVVFSTVLRNKPLSRAFDLFVAVGMDAGLGLAPVATASVAARSAVEARLDTDARADLALAPIMAAGARVARAVVPVLPPEVP